MRHEELYQPWGTVTPAFWESSGAPQPAAASPYAAPVEEVPRTVHEQLSAIAAAAAAGQHAEASAQAHRLDEEITAQYGESHLHTVHIREVRAHIAHLAEDHSAAVGWYLHTARLRAAVQGNDHPDTEHATLLVYSLWRALPTADSVRLGGDLLATVTDLYGPDAPLAARTRRRLTSLTASSSA
ncbi:hypothetical protein ACFYWY_11250 [Streptomyces sp. NPDC002870]|uniref:hypothetical protein n=1 Tax=Streptomyces sp. NPDC002870 TaxID=3364666 RepID=UPI003697ECFC